VDKSDLKNLTEKIFLLYEEENKKLLFSQNINKIMLHDSVEKIMNQIYGS